MEGTIEFLNKEIGFVEFVRQFQDHEYCEDYLKEFRWPNGVICPFCGSDKLYICSKRGKIKHQYSCAKPTCRKKFSLISGTVFDNTKFPLSTWLMLIYQNSLNKKNISSRQLAKNFGGSQKTLWGLQHKIRSVLYQDDIILSGIIEVDEAFVSKGNKWTRWGGITTRKEPVLGLIERQGNVVLKLIPDRLRATIIPLIVHHVAPGSTIYTDGHLSYRRLPNIYNHDYVDHSTREYARGDVHTNNIENVWGFFKKSIRNAHHSISAKHLQVYLDEAAYRFNNRHLSSFDRFHDILSRCLNNPPVIIDKRPHGED